MPCPSSSRKGCSGRGWSLEWLRLRICSDSALLREAPRERKAARQSRRRACCYTSRAACQVAVAAQMITCSGGALHGCASEERGVRWDVVRGDLAHVLEEIVFNGALGRDLQSSKDTQGRDPAVSYGDVQLHRHLERLQDLVTVVPASPRCALGRHALRLFVSVLYSGLQWRDWFARYQSDLAGVVHSVNWTWALSTGWPVFQLLSLVGDLLGHIEAPAECGPVDWDSLAAKPPAAVTGVPRCLFGNAVVAAARALLAAGAHAADVLLAPRLLAQFQHFLRRALGDGSSPDYRLLFAAPLPRLFSKLSALSYRSLDAARLDIVYCGQLDIAEELEGLCGSRQCGLRVLVTDSPAHTSEVCYSHYRKSAMALRRHDFQSAEGGSNTVLVSPWAWRWGSDSTKDLRRLLSERERWRHLLEVVGTPCINSSRVWNWPVRRVRHAYWKLAYEEYATGYETSPYMGLAQFWAVGDTTSATRVYSTSAYLRLVEAISRHEALYPSSLPTLLQPQGSEAAGGASQWFLELDLAAKELGIKAHTLLSGNSWEDDYVSRASLTWRLARTFHIEAARFTAGGEYQERCLFDSSKQASQFTSAHGVVTSWCIRQKLRRMFQVVGRWWLGMRPRKHIIVPVSASLLNLFRGGERELFPWDADIDANFIAGGSEEVVVGRVMEEHAATLSALGYGYILRGDRVVIRDADDSVRMDIWISGPQDVEAYDIRARMCGVRVNTFRQQLDGTVWYYRPGEKIAGNTQGILLHCKWPGHNACLPDCVRGGLGVGSDGCEFADSFVHPDF